MSCSAAGEAVAHRRSRDLLLELKDFTVVRPLWQCVQPVAPDLRFATMVNGRYVFVSDPEALLCKGQVLPSSVARSCAGALFPHFALTIAQVLSISGNIDDAHNKVSVEDRSREAGDD